MPKRDVTFVTGGYYHVFNRGVAKQDVFFSEYHYARFIKTLDYYLYERRDLSFSHYLSRLVDAREGLMESMSGAAGTKRVELLAYVLMPNHFHLLLKQVDDEGVMKLMRQLGNSYTKYVNTLGSRVGPLFQGRFKAVRIASDEQLLHVSRYIHLNPYKAGLVGLDNLLEYEWSSLNQYVGKQSTGTLMVGVGEVMSMFSDSAEYWDFVRDEANQDTFLELLSRDLIDFDE